MKQFVPVIAMLLTLTLSTTAQKGIPAFGKIDKADLEMKDCDFDIGAEAIKLIDWGNVYYERGTAGISLFKTYFEKRVRIKILKEKGIEQANIRIPFYSHNNDEKIQKLEAFTYNLDNSGNIKKTEVEKNSVYTKKITRNSSELIIAFPEVKSGSIIEYKYRMERETMGQIKDWYFQDRIPTVYSEYQLKIPGIFQFNTNTSITNEKDLDYQVKAVDEDINFNDGGYVSLTSKKMNYIMHNLKGVKEVPYMGALKDYLQRIEFRLSSVTIGTTTTNLNSTWGDLVKQLNLDEDFGLQIQKEIPGTEKLVRDMAAVDGNEKKAAFLMDYLRKYFSWDKEQSIYSFQGVKDTWEKKKGNSGDLNILFINLMVKAGVVVNPILMSTRDNGVLNIHYPFPDQFNTVMAYLSIGERYLILDVTEKYLPNNIIPAKVNNTRGFIIQGENGKWIDVIDAAHQFKMMVAFHAQIDDAMLMTGDCLVNSTEYARTSRCSEWMNDKEKFKKDHFLNANPAVKAEKLEVNNTASDNLPLEQKLSFSIPLSGTGAYKYFTINLFTDFNSNPFLEEERIADIDFGYLQDHTIFANISIPSGYQFEELPKDMIMTNTNKDFSFERTMSADDNLLNVRISILFKQTFYPTADYPEFKEFYKKLLLALNEQIVIKKK